MSTEERLNRTIAECFGLEKVKLTDRLVDDLDADSLDVVELLIAVEDEFGCEIPDEAALKVVTVGDMHNLMVELKKTVGLRRP